MKKKSITVLLALFLGYIGIHRFYLGQKKAGILYIIFLCTCIPVIIAIIDCIRFLNMSEEVFNEKYNSIIRESKPVVNYANIETISDEEFEERRKKLFKI